MVGCKQIDCLRELSNYREHVSHTLEVNNPQTNTPPLHVVHNNPIE